MSAVPSPPKITFYQRLRNLFKAMTVRLHPATVNPHKVHFVYLVPSDKSNTSESAIAQAAIHLQRWYRWQMVNGKTFTLNSPIVQVYQTSHSSQWYSTNPNGDFAGWFWNNTLQDLATYAGGGFYQEFDDWVTYVDAEPQPGQFAGGTSSGYTSGVAVLGSHDLDSLRGQSQDWPQCRGIGGSGHEMGHTFGLPHPPAGDPQWPVAIMGVGYTTYPSALLRRADRDQLNANPFFAFADQSHPSTPGPCPFDDSATT